jgi:hypothetical protein
MTDMWRYSLSLLSANRHVAELTARLRQHPSLSTIADLITEVMQLNTKDFLSRHATSGKPAVEIDN